MSPDDAAKRLGEKEDLDDYVESGVVNLNKDFWNVESILENIKQKMPRHNRNKSEDNKYRSRTSINHYFLPKSKDKIDTKSDLAIHLKNSE